jgi:ribonuclease BN (tRNA processing enzyme)
MKKISIMAAKTDKQLAQLRLDLEQLSSGIETHAAEIGDAVTIGGDTVASKRLGRLARAVDVLVMSCHYGAMFETPNLF